jgi:uncharacterized YigZ family protein
MRPYLTVAGAGEAEQTIERSRFIGYARPAKTPEECEAFFCEIRKLHRDATHNVPAYVLGIDGCLQWAGDDGEPRGTSGAPLAHMLVSEGISATAVVVTRYFGGVKLGTGGLVRAYTSTAKLAIAAAGMSEVSERLVIALISDYSAYNRIIADKSGIYTAENVSFTDVVRTELVMLPENRDVVVAAVQSLAPGAKIDSEQIRIVRTPLQ